MLNRIFVPAAGGEYIPLEQVAELRRVPDPVVINSENTLTHTRVFINVEQNKVGLVGFVKNAQEAVQSKIKSGEIKLPSSYSISWSGQFKSEMESRKKLIPSLVICLAIIIVLLYMAFKNFSVLLILSTGLPVSLMGGIILLFLLGFSFSTAVRVGFIARASHFILFLINQNY